MANRRPIVCGVVLAGLALAGCGDADDGPDCEVPAGAGPVMPATGLCKRLSTYRLFADLAQQQADPALVPYDLVVPLFSDYTDKRRWLYLPPGAAAAWRDVDALELPVGAMLVKTFAYLDDRRAPAAGTTLLETRVLLRQTSGWKAGAYVYRADGSDAELALAGDVLDASWIHDDGATRTNRWVVPDANQCLNCHGEHQARMSPLGVKARHLNRPAPDGAANQLQALVDAGRLTGAPDPTTWPRDPAPDDGAAPLEARARAWLDVNCAHCHRPEGPASNSGLFLTWGEKEPVRYGVNKRPVAAGKGSGDRQFDIVPGDPDASILIYRVDSVEPGVMMPELGRHLPDPAAVALLREWIAAMK